MTIKDHIMTLPDGYRELALKYEDDVWLTDEDDVYNALAAAFIFDLSLEGYEFWSNVCDHYELGTPLPPLPNNKP